MSIQVSYKKVKDNLIKNYVLFSDENFKIYNLEGLEITTLINDKLSVGNHSIQWKATNNLGQPVSAGIYLYQIQAGEYISTKKMVLLK